MDQQEAVGATEAGDELGAMAWEIDQRWRELCCVVKRHRWWYFNMFSDDWGSTIMKRCRRCYRLERDQ